ncbi:hypothetical protein BJ912DRAFT_989114 [Pholiota molesta]|nr:hypothetical protein BJ912DRAFT_989114 [Pholiota molesta]
MASQDVVVIVIVAAATTVALRSHVLVVAKYLVAIIDLEYAVSVIKHFTLHIDCVERRITVVVIGTGVVRQGSPTRRRRHCRRRHRHSLAPDGTPHWSTILQKNRKLQRLGWVRGRHG